MPLRNSSYWPYKNFTKAEVKCHCGDCSGLPSHRLMEKIQAMRTEAGFPFRVNSGFRCPAYNKSIGGGPTHPLGLAIDIGVSGNQAYTVVKLAMAHGIKGIGVSQQGKYGGRFIHLDIADNGIIEGIYRPTIWSY